MRGFGWSGELVSVSDPSFPGVVDPIAWIKPNRVTKKMRSQCIELIRDATGGGEFKLPGNFVHRWETSGSSSSHSYSLRPTVVIA